ncbi:MAG TPA: GNAT family N-acetyltransferase [Hyphomicrobium sp.]
MAAQPVHIESAPPDSLDARWCLDQYFRELAAGVDGGFDPVKTAHVDPEDIAPPAGAFLIARLEGRPVGCGALRAIDRDVGEVKRMWVHARARRLGVGRRILEALESQARARGLRTLRLDTNRALKEAHALYGKLGYVEVERFNDEPYAHHWFAKSLPGR